MTTIDVVLTPPNPLTDPQATFNSKALAFTQALTPWAAQVNTVAGEVNADKVAAAASAVAAADSVTDAAEQVTLAAAEKVAAQGFAEDAADSAALAASSAGSAVNAPGTSATSTTSISISSGSITLTIQTGKAFVVGQFVSVSATSSPANYMSGQITAHNSGAGSLTVNATQVNGSGTFAAWTIAVIGAPGAGSATGDILFTANTLSAPAYLPCDGATYLKSSYPTLAGKLGALGLFDDPIPIASVPTVLTSSGTIYGSDWSPDGTYFAIAASSSPVRVMKRSGETLSNLSLSVGQTTSAYEVVFDGVDGTYLGEAGTSSPYVKFHKRTVDSFAALSNPASLPPGACLAIDCSTDGVYWAVLSTSSPFLVLYKRTGDTFAKLTDPATMPGINGNSLSFSPDGQYLAVATSTTSPNIRMYQRAGDVFTAITFQGVIPPGADIRQVKYDPTGRYLAARSGTPGVSSVFVYDTQNSWSLKTIPLLDGDSNSFSYSRFGWSSDGNLLSVPMYYGPAIFDVSSGFARLPGPVMGSAEQGTTHTVSFSPDAIFFVCAGESGNAKVWKRRYNPSTLFSTPRIVGAKAYIKT